MKLKEEFKSRKFLFGCVATIIFCVSVWVFNQPYVSTATSLTVLYASFFVGNVIEKFKKPQTF